MKSHHHLGIIFALGIVFVPGMPFVPGITLVVRLDGTKLGVPMFGVPPAPIRTVGVDCGGGGPSLPFWLTTMPVAAAPAATAIRAIVVAEIPVPVPTPVATPPAAAAPLAAAT